MNDPEFYDAAWEEYVTSKTGPFTHAWGNHIVFESLQDLDPKFESIANSLDTQDPLDHLPPVYAENPSLVEGFIEQRKVLQSQFRSSAAGVVEITFGGSVAVPVALQKPLSRGTIFINSTDPDPSIPPLIDFNVNANPVDMFILIRALEKTREFMGSESVASLEPMEVSPGPTIDTDVEIEEVMRESLLSPSFDHPVGTAAMMPRELGGVVDTGLQVYGVEGLWVADASIMPLVPAAHTQATVYAVAEYAAELIRSRGKTG
jgi:choline dehydrogenase-like flavoprotein